MKNKYIVFLIFTLVFMLSPRVASAQNNVSLGVYPPVIEINADPPAVVESKIAIQNLSETTEDLDIIFRPFKLSSERDGQIEFLPEGDLSGPDPLILQKVKIKDSEGQYIDSLSLSPFEAQELTLEIDIGEKDPIGDYYFSIIFLAQGEEHPSASSTLATGGIGTNVILGVGKKGETKGEILKFETPLINTTGPIPLTLLVKNNSEHYFTPSGTVSIKNMFGKEVGRLSILPQYILAGAERYLRDEAQASPSAELAETVRKLSKDSPKLIWADEFLLGPYTAEVHLKLAENGPLFVTKTTFFAIPLYIVFTISLFTFVILGIWLRVKNKIKK